LAIEPLDTVFAGDDRADPGFFTPAIPDNRRA
jgi:hypothetical protein